MEERFNVTMLTIVKLSCVGMCVHQRHQLALTCCFNAYPIQLQAGIVTAKMCHTAQTGKYEICRSWDLSNMNSLLYGEYTAQK